MFLTGEPPPPATKASEPLVVFVGAFGSRKRGDLALAAAARARRLLPNLRLAVVGPADDRSKYPPWVDFFASPGDDEVQALIAEAWVLLAPSSYEGFGIPAWEAMMARAAVVATTNPGMEFLSAGGTCCTIVEPHQLGDALARLLQSEPDRADQSRRGFARACEVAALGRPERYASLFHTVASA